jgi:hypothetical protein
MGQQNLSAFNIAVMVLVTPSDIAFASQPQGTSLA